MNKKQLQREQSRQNILQAAAELFARKGYLATSVEDIAAATHTGKTNIYYHFKSKEGLFHQLMLRHQRDWLQYWESQKHRYPTAVEQLYALVELSVTRGFALHKAAAEFLQESWCKNEEFMVDMAEKCEENRRFLAEIIRMGMDNGEFRQGDARLFGHILESLFRGLDDAAKSLDLEQTKTLYRTGLNVFLQGISASSEEASVPSNHPLP